MALAPAPALDGDPLAASEPEGNGSLFLASDAASFQRPVRIFEHEPDLLEHLTPRAARLAWHLGVADSTILEAGHWSPPDEAALGRGALGLMVLDGLLTRSVGFDG